MKMNTWNIVAMLIALGVGAGCGSASGTKNPSQQTDAGVKPGGSDAGTGPGTLPQGEWPRTGPIAPECVADAEWCGPVFAAAHLSCKDEDGAPYTITTAFSGKTDQVSCIVGDNGDLGLSIAPGAQSGLSDAHQVRFRLRNDTGVGTYELTRLDGEGSEHGLTIPGKGSGSQAGESSSEASRGSLRPLALQGHRDRGEPDDSARGFRARIPPARRRAVRPRRREAVVGLQLRAVGLPVHREATAVFRREMLQLSVESTRTPRRPGGVSPRAPARPHTTPGTV